MSTTTELGSLFLLDELTDSSRTGDLAAGDLAALTAVADWIRSYVLRPHKELVGHAGTVCPFLPESVRRNAARLASEHVADGGAPRILELMHGYKRRLLAIEPSDGDVNYNVITVVFPDLPADRAQAAFAEVFEELAVPSYVEDGVLFGPYYQGNETAAIYNSSFRPFESPVPFLFVRHGVVDDWKFFLDDEVWRELWAQRNGASGARALAEELRRLPWRTPHDQPCANHSGLTDSPRAL